MTQADRVSTGNNTGRRRLWAVSGAVWLCVALISVVQGQVFAAFAGRSQAWWPTFHYTVAIFSVWALLTPAVLHAARRVEERRFGRVAALSLWLAGYPLTVMAHLTLFVLLFWPIYGGPSLSLFAMAKAVFLANLDKSAFAYIALIALARLRRQWTPPSDVPSPPSLANTAPAGEDGLWVRVAGGQQRVPFQDIDWIAAAGDYAEIHAGERTLLTDRSLASLTDELPAAAFVRVHRGAIVRLDRVREVRSLGRGDASLILHNGETLRLSRRYREGFKALLPV
ncbi:LytR/AlgR family response regulator transcription factor [Niveispirillum cyanobacteriorum]|uniref:LytR/AlgR family response regulator transcription factor n=1 Tax=Niveispirillum cyanobacteriorum TaxID=1612173 RepID=UPI001319DA06|nr:LytTR family DNA-binding domain-containing protein [Niveispirillum cyanobacteriorum]GGE61928.1 hypothetical protein GCM10011317_19440 [Niveispirillum cyanobacteriorum]